MESPADTLNYLLAGYAVIFGIILIYIASLAVRWRNLRQDEAVLDESEKPQ